MVLESNVTNERMLLIGGDTFGRLNSVIYYELERQSTLLYFVVAIPYCIGWMFDVMLFTTLNFC